MPGMTEGQCCQMTGPKAAREAAAPTVFRRSPPHRTISWQKTQRGALAIAARSSAHRSVLRRTSHRSAQNEENSKEFPTGHFTISRKVIVHLPHSAAGTRGKAFPFPMGTASERHRTAREPWNLSRCYGGGTTSREASHSPPETVSPLWGERAGMPTSRLFAFSPSKTPFYSS